MQHGERGELRYNTAKRVTEKCSMRFTVKYSWGGYSKIQHSGYRIIQHRTLQQNTAWRVTAKYSTGGCSKTQHGGLQQNTAWVTANTTWPPTRGFKMLSKTALFHYLSFCCTVTAVYCFVCHSFS